MWLLRADRLGELCSHLIHKEPSVKFGAWGQSEKNSNSVQRAGGLTGCRLGVGGGNGHGPESRATGQAGSEERGRVSGSSVLGPLGRAWPPSAGGRGGVGVRSEWVVWAEYRYWSQIAWH